MLKTAFQTPIVNSRTDAEECGRYFRAIAAHKIVPSNELASPTVVTPTTPTPSPPKEPSQKENSNTTLENQSLDEQVINTSNSEESRNVENGTDENSLENKEDQRAANSSANNTNVVRPRSSRNPADRARVLEQSFTVKSKDKVLLRLRAEMLDQDTEKHEFGTNYLIRAFVERILVLYLQRNDKNRQPRNDQDLTQKCADDAKQANAPQKVQHILNQAASTTHCGHSLHTLGTAIHGGTIPTRTSLNNVFDTWEPALKFMLDAINATNP